MVRAKGARSVVTEIWETPATAALPKLGEAQGKLQEQFCTLWPKVHWKDKNVQIQVAHAHKCHYQDEQLDENQNLNTCT